MKLATFQTNKGASYGIVHGDSVTCPLHSWKISLRSGQALGDDEGCTPTIPVKVDAGRIYLLREAVVASKLGVLPAKAA